MKKETLKTIKRTMLGLLMTMTLLIFIPNNVKADAYDQDDWNEVYAWYEGGYIDIGNLPHYLSIGKKYYETELEYGWGPQRAKIKYHKGAEYKVTSSNPKVLKAYVKDGFVYFNGISEGEATIYLKRKINGKFKTVAQVTKSVKNTCTNMTFDSYDVELGDDVGYGGFYIVNHKYGYDYKAYVDKKGLEVYLTGREDNSKLKTPYYIRYNAKKAGTYTVVIKEIKGTEKRVIQKFKVKVHKPFVEKKIEVERYDWFFTSNLINYLPKDYITIIEMVGGKTDIISDEDVNAALEAAFKKYKNLDYCDLASQYIKKHPSYKNKQFLVVNYGEVNPDGHAGFNKIGKAKVRVYICPVNEYFNNLGNAEKTYIGTTTITIKNTLLPNK